MSTAPSREAVRQVIHELLEEGSGSRISRRADSTLPELLLNEHNLFDDLGIDSLGLVELVMALEDRYKLEVPDEDAERVTTVGEAIDLVLRELS